VNLVKLAADMASFNNASPDQVLEALRSGLSGETEPLRQFGVFLNEARVKAEAMSLGLVKATKDTTKIQSAQITATLAQKTYNAAVKEHGKGSSEAQKALVSLNNAQGALNKATSGSIPALTAAQKATATYSLIVKDTKDAQGDFARTSISLANQQRILKAQFEDVMAVLGAQLIPVLTDAALALSHFITEMQKGTGAGGAFVDMVKFMSHNFSEFVKHTREDIDLLLGAFVTIVDGVGQVARTLSHVDPTGAMGKVADRAQRAADKINHLREEIRPAGHEFDDLNAAADELGHSLASNFEKGSKGADALGHSITTVNTKFAGLQQAADAALGGLAQAIKKPTGALKRVGDGVGKSAAMSIPGIGSANLMGASSKMAPFASIGAKFGLHVSSGLRPGAITSSGNVSYHASGQAIDEAGSPAGMMGFFKYMRSTYGSRLAELIYTPGGTGIKDGKPFKYSGQVAADHFDHVHVAFTGGGDGIGRRARTGDGYGKAQLQALWRRAGGPVSKESIAAAVALAESGGDPSISNRNRDGSIDRGLWQINSVHGAMSTFNPLANAKAAVKISSAGRNWNPWTVFRTGAYKKFLGKASDATAAARKGSTLRGGEKAHAHGISGKRKVGTGLSEQQISEMNAQREYDLAKQAANAPIPSDTGSGEDPAAEAAQQQAAAAEALRAAVDQLRAAIQEQTNFARSVAATSSAQAFKALADIMSGQLGDQVNGRSHTAGDGSIARY